MERRALFSPAEKGFRLFFYFLEVFSRVISCKTCPEKDTGDSRMNSLRLSDNSAGTLRIVEKDGIQAVSARELHKGLNIQKRFSEWWKTNSKDFVENEDFTGVYLKVQGNQYGGEQELQDYAISLDMAKSICLMSRTEIGRQYRQYLINLEKAWNSPEKVMERALAIAHQKAEEATRRIMEMQPKALVYDRISNASGLKSVEEVAKNLGWGKNNFFALMRGTGIFYYSNSASGKINLPKQDFIKAGYFKTVEEPYRRGDKDVVYTKIYVTGKGETWLANKLNEAVEDSADKWIGKEAQV